MKAVIVDLSSIKPLDVLEHAFGTPLIIEGHVLHRHQLEDWDYSFLLHQNRNPFAFHFWDIGTACGRGHAASD